MPRRVIVQYTCSFCGGDGVDPGHFSTFTMAAAEGTKVAELPKPLGFDACRPCMETEPMTTLLKVGYPLTKPKASSGAAVEATERAETTPHLCDVCGRSFVAAQGLAAHRRWHADPATTEAYRASLRAARAREGKARKAAAKR